MAATARWCRIAANARRRRSRGGPDRAASATRCAPRIGQRAPRCVASVAGSSGKVGNAFNAPTGYHVAGMGYARGRRPIGTRCWRCPPAMRAASASRCRRSRTRDERAHRPGDQPARAGPARPLSVLLPGSLPQLLRASDLRRLASEPTRLVAVPLRAIVAVARAARPVAPTAADRAADVAAAAAGVKTSTSRLTLVDTKRRTPGRMQQDEAWHPDDAAEARRPRTAPGAAEAEAAAATSGDGRARSAGTGAPRARRKRSRQRARRVVRHGRRLSRTAAAVHAVRASRHVPVHRAR